MQRPHNASQMADVHSSLKAPSLSMEFCVVNSGEVLFGKEFEDILSNNTDWREEIPRRSIVLSTTATTGSCMMDYNGLETVPWEENVHSNDSCKIARNIPLPG